VINEELNALKKNKTWELVDLHPGEKAVGNKWAFKIKHDSEGKVTRYKARLVAKGFAQTYGFNYTETFSCSKALHAKTSVFFSCSIGLENRPLGHCNCSFA
jgi:hypothetical protein